MELTQTELRNALENPAFAPRLGARQIERFDAAELAALLEKAANETVAHGLSHVSMNMNITDCRAMIRFLRRAVLAGV
jgi:hypothetical protein